ncbi:MAG: hypothetical protein ACLSHC_09060 [Bilophila wadsworthia]
MADGVSIDVGPFRGAPVENVIAVAAVAHRLGWAPRNRRRIRRGRVAETALCLFEGGDWLVIDDSTTNRCLFPDVEAAPEMAGIARWPLVCVLGEMGELGSLRG